MPILIHHLPPQADEIRSLWKSEDCPIAQGSEGQLVRDQMETVNRHWHAQSQEYLSETEDELLEELNNYRHVPFEYVGSIQVQFTGIKDLPPRKSVFDEDDQ